MPSELKPLVDIKINDEVETHLALSVNYHTICGIDGEDSVLGHNIIKYKSRGTITCIFCKKIIGAVNDWNRRSDDAKAKEN